MKECNECGYRTNDFLVAETKEGSKYFCGDCTTKYYELVEKENDRLESYEALQQLKTLARSWVLTVKSFTHDSIVPDVSAEFKELEEKMQEFEYQVKEAEKNLRTYY